MIPPTTAQLCPGGWEIIRMVSGVVRSAYGVPEGMFEKPVERDWDIAARGGTASGKESEFLAMKRAVEARAIVFLGRVVMGIVPSAIVGGGEGEEGMGPVRLLIEFQYIRNLEGHTDIREESSAWDTKLEEGICNLMVSTSVAFYK
jgi:hypothetical protein